METLAEEAVTKAAAGRKHEFEVDVTPTLTYIADQYPGQRHDPTWTGRVQGRVWTAGT